MPEGIYGSAPIQMINSIWAGALFVIEDWVIEDWPFYKCAPLYPLLQRADSAPDTSISLRRTILVWLTNLKPR